LRTADDERVVSAARLGEVATNGDEISDEEPESDDIADPDEQGDA
jgi:hypothetical protein